MVTFPPELSLLLMIITAKNLSVVGKSVAGKGLHKLKKNDVEASLSTSLVCSALFFFFPHFLSTKIDSDHGELPIVRLPSKGLRDSVSPAKRASTPAKIVQLL